MTTVITATLFLMFSAWVWTLKQEVRHLQSRSHRASHGGAGAASERHSSKQKVAAPGEGAGCQRVSGVPTWTIE